MFVKSNLKSATIVRTFFFLEKLSVVKPQFLFCLRAAVEKQGMAAATGVEEVMILWNTIVGWFVAFVLPHTFHCSCGDICPRATALGTALPHSTCGISVAGANLDPVLIEEWCSALWWSLKLDVSNSLCSKELKRALFTDDTETKNIHSNQDDRVTKNTTSQKEGNDDGVETESPLWIVKGIPERPLYREVAKRLLQWNQQRIPRNSSASTNHTLCEANQCNVMISAQELGFEELAFFHGRTALPEIPPSSKSDIPNWLLSCRDGDTNADATIYKLLGIRNTIGSLLPCEKRLSLLPSKRALMESAGAFYEPKQKVLAGRNSKRKQQLLTVAAKARSKHAPRAIEETSFFGVARGPVVQQNQEAKDLVGKLLENCVWINCHVFGGLAKTKTIDDGTNGNDFSSWVVEIREEQGYGARWRVEECGHDATKKHDLANESGNYPSTALIFRGFLEPQMEDGHGRRWRH